MCTTFYRFYIFFVCIYVIVQTLYVYIYEQKKKDTELEKRIVEKNIFVYFQRSTLATLIFSDAKFFIKYPVMLNIL